LRYLLDTHTLLWWFHEPENLSVLALEAIRDADNDVLVSAVSAIEIATKHRKGQLEYDSVLAVEFTKQTELEGFISLAITSEHAQLAGAFPGNLADPWDRILSAQARLEGLQLLSRDRRIAELGLQPVW
jgi:PIN domain nuclease of toxin-antitoxin system